jgi:sugar lactone lactonase YvrE
MDEVYNVMKNVSKWTKGVIQRYAGTGIRGYGCDGEEAIATRLGGPAGLAVDRADNIYVAEFHNNVIRKIDSKTGRISTVAGCGLKGSMGDGGPAVCAQLNGPEGVFVDSSGNIYIADTYNHKIRKVDAKTGAIKTIAGTGHAGYDGDGIKADDTRLDQPSGIVVDSKGNVYFNDYKNDRVRKIDTSGYISTYAGTGIPGYSGDGGPAYKAGINDVYGLAIDRHDNLYIMDSLNFSIRKVDAATGTISTVIGKGKPGEIVEYEKIGNSYIGGPVHEKGNIGIEAPHAVEVDQRGNIFIGDTGSNRIRMADVQCDLVYTIAGNGTKGNSGDGGIARAACLNVHGLRMDSKGNLYFVDFLSHVIRVIRFG